MHKVLLLIVIIRNSNCINQNAIKQNVKNAIILRAALEPAHFHCMNILRMQVTLQKTGLILFFLWRGRQNIVCKVFFTKKKTMFWFLFYVPVLFSLWLTSGHKLRRSEGFCCCTKVLNSYLISKTTYQFYLYERKLVLYAFSQSVWELLFFSTCSSPYSPETPPTSF